MKNKTYMVLVADRKNVLMFTLVDGIVGEKYAYASGDVPQKVKHGDDTWDAADKIFRHIEDHLHKHLVILGQQATAFAEGKNVTGLIIGSHKPLFSKIEKHISSPLAKKVKGRFVTEIKIPFNDVVRHAKTFIDELENEEEVKKKNEALAR